MECHYVVAGDKFGPKLKGCILKTIQALYGLKLAGTSFHAHLALILLHAMGLILCEADPNIWMHLAKKPNGTSYYKYVLCYVNDVLIISNKLKGHFVLKEALNPATKQQHYVHATIGNYNFLDGSYGWYMLVREYLSHAIPAIKTTWNDKLYQKASLLLMVTSFWWDHDHWLATLIWFSSHESHLFPGHPGTRPRLIHVQSMADPRPIQDGPQ